MNLYRSPILFLVVALIAISVGTLVTTFIPLLKHSNYTEIDGITPYSPLELEGRDIYVREGCNNCHTQTVRPLDFETKRYGEYSRAGEFVYDRPFLWGSKRTGPDLARIGGKYNDAWHLIHFDDPRKIAPRSNMPGYGWMKDEPVDPAFIEKKMQALGFPYTPSEISGLQGKTEMDAMVAYMQKLGSDFKKVMAAKEAMATPPVAAAPAEPVAEAVVNKYAGDHAAIEAGHEIFEAQCQVCHGEHLTGGIGPSLVDAEWLYGSDDASIHDSIMKGRPNGMPPIGATIGEDAAWKVVAFIKSEAK
jgi:cytochrome c oxidase cbb3-type subunit 2